MFARRNLRRNLVIIICLPVVLLGLFVIHQNRDAVFPEHSSHLLSDTNKISSVRSKRSTIYQNGHLMMVNPQTNPFVNVYNNHHQQVQGYRPFQQLTYPVINATNLERFVHLDLKGAAPKVDYYEKLFPFLKQLGATGLLIEYEDMFPYTDRLALISHGLSYSKNDIQRILQLAENNGLKVMPLLQVYGHLEYVLKLKEFMHLREDSRYPQVITPCLEESYKLIFGIYR
jgi:hypothetical protein